MKASISLDEGVAPTLLQLLQCALCGTAVVRATAQEGAPAGTTQTKPKKDGEKEKETDKAEGMIQKC